MSDYIPSILNAEIEHIRSEICHSTRQNQFFAFSLIFDGTTRFAETYNIITCFVLNNKAQQRVIDLKLLSKSLNGQQLTNLLSRSMQKYDLSEENLVAIMLDRASINCVVRFEYVYNIKLFIYLYCHVHRLELI